LSGLYAEQKEPVLKRHGRRIASGIACSAAIAFFMHLGVVKLVITWAAHIVLFIFGHPPGAEKLDRLEDKVVHAIEKGKDAVHKHSPGQDGQPAAPLLAKALEPMKQAVAPVKEAVAVARKVEDVKEKAAEGVQTIKKTGDKVADAIHDVSDKAKQGVSGMGTGIAEAYRARAEARDKAERETLEASAAMIRFPTDKEWSLPRLRAEVAKAERQYQLRHGANAQCPDQRCRYGMRITSKGTDMRRCPRCGGIFSPRQALSLGPPPMRHH
jgi:hypothetical protein